MGHWIRFVTPQKTAHACKQIKRWRGEIKWNFNEVKQNKFVSLYLSCYHGGLQAVRDALIFAYAENVIDDEEFALLYDYNRSKPLFPHWKFEDFDLRTWDEVECRTELWFGKNDLPLLLRCLQIPEQVVCQQGTVCSGMEGLCIVLKRLAYPCRYTDMAHTDTVPCACNYL